MALGENQRLKLLYLLKIFHEETDDGHGLSIKEIAQKLDAYGVSADRKTLYGDFEALRTFGVEILFEQNGRDYTYHIGTREFELPELKLLVDSVQSAKFLSAKKSSELIGKLESLCSRHEAKHLQRQVLISDRIKTMNESIYYSVDTLHEAINTGRQVRFHYYQWNIRKEMTLRKNGTWYTVSPWSLMWDDENYYLVAFDAEDQKIKHYRVDKMLHLSVVDREREGKEQFLSFSLPKYTKSLFGMYGGELTEVTIEGRNDLVGVMIDRFGKDIPIRVKDAEHFTARVSVAVSRQFLGWMFAMGDGLRITAPDSVVQMMADETEQILRIYRSEG